MPTNTIIAGGCNVAIPQNPIEMVKDTIEFFAQNPDKRAYDHHEGACRYRTTPPEGEFPLCCAVGRYIPDANYTRDMEGGNLRDHILPLSVVPASWYDIVSKLQAWHDSWDREQADEEDQPRFEYLTEVMTQLFHESDMFAPEETIEIFAGCYRTT